MKLSSQLSLGAAVFLSATTLSVFTLSAMGQGTTGKLHGRVTDPTGMPKAAGTIGLSTDMGKTLKYTFPLSASGDFSGADIAPGTYTMLLRLPDTAEGKYVDEIDNVKITAGQDLLQDDDMSRKEYLDKMTPEQRKQVEEFKKKNAEIMKGNMLIKNLNGDLNQARQDNKDKKFDDAEALMLKDTALKPDGELLWYELGMAQVGLKKWPDAQVTLKKVIDLDTASKKPSPELQGGAYAALGEVLARSGKTDDAAAQYDLAAKAFPSKAGFYFTNEAVVYSNVGAGDAQVAAADKAIAADPKAPLPYYLKGQALAAKISVDAKSGAYILPPGLLEADNKYLELAPDGPYAPEVKAILAETQSKVKSTYKAKK